MKERKTLSGENASVIWEQVNADFLAGGAYDYHAVIQHENHHIALDIVSSPGGGAEGGYGTTTISTPLTHTSSFRFSLQPEDVLNRIGRLFGMQDIKMGYPDFDDKVIVQSSDEQQLRTVLDDPIVREYLTTMSGYRLAIVEGDDGAKHQLELFVQRAIFDVNELRRQFDTFYHVLRALDK